MDLLWLADVSTLRTFSSDNTVSLSRSSAETLDSVDPTDATGLVDEEQDSVEGAVVKDVDPLPKDEGPVLEKPVVEKVKDIPPKPEPVGTAVETKPKPTTDPSDDPIAPKKPDVAKEPKKAAGVDKDAGDPKDAGADAKPAPSGGGE